VFPPESTTVELIHQHRVYIFANPWDHGSPQAQGLLPRRPCAGLVVGRRGRRYVFIFVLQDGWNRDVLDFTLNTVRAALGTRLKDEQVRGTFRQAAEIQHSLLPDDPPSFPGYEMACRTVPAEEVGGDFFDFLPLGKDTMGVAIGDASGHGLPAALLVRDVVTGLRMGIEKELRVAPVFARLNRVIHRSNLSSRFVSVFYGELARSGNLIYVNAGHLPPLLFSRRGVERLETGGTVIGPLPHADFDRGVARMEPGSTLVLCTDGILERRNSAGEDFEKARLQKVVLEAGAAGAEEILERVFTAAFEHGGDRPWEDDATVVVVRRRP
jgi:sigma-B regulation protein RsbU (phosphoserine phosphatase)